MSDVTHMDPTPGPAPRSRWRWLLIASLALNFLVLGAMAGAWVFGHRHGPGRWGATPMEHGLMHFSRQLPEDRREAVRRHLKEGRQAMKPLKEDLRKARISAAEVLGSADYTPEKMRAAMEAAGAADLKLRQNGVDVVIKAIGTLTPEDRKSLSEAWSRRLKHEDRRNRKFDKNDDGPKG